MSTLQLLITIFLFSCSVTFFIMGMAMFAFWDTLKFFNNMKRYYRFMGISLVCCGAILFIDPSIALYNFIVLISLFFLMCMMGIIWKYL